MRKIFYLIAAILISSCGKNRLDVDVSNINVNLKITRFEDDIFSIPKNKYNADIEKIRNRDSDFFDVYVRRVLGLLVVENLSTTYMLNGFVNADMIKKIYDTVHTMYNNFSDISDEIKKSLKYFSYHFPKLKTPDVITYISEYGNAVAPFEDKIGIGLDLFLGENYSGYKMFPNEFPNYRLRRMNKNYVSQAFVQGLFSYYFEHEPFEKTFLAAMIEEGKRQYFIDAMMPDFHDSIRREYSQKQLEWCKKNEVQIWNHFSEKKLFFSNNSSDFFRYMNDGPFTGAPDVPPESAPRIGMYIGYNIVKNYMEKNEKISLENLLRERDYKKILKESGYHPN